MLNSTRLSVRGVFLIRFVKELQSRVVGLQVPAIAGAHLTLEANHDRIFWRDGDGFSVMLFGNGDATVVCVFLQGKGSYSGAAQGEQ